MKAVSLSDIEIDWLPDVLNFFDATNLNAALAGYAWNARSNQPLDDWPNGAIVFASSGGDPLVVMPDIDGVFTAMHGMGRWEWKQLSGSFGAFLNLLISWQSALNIADEKRDHETFELSEKFILELRKQMRIKDIPDEFGDRLIELA